MEAFVLGSKGKQKEKVNNGVLFEGLLTFCACFNKVKKW